MRSLLLLALLFNVFSSFAQQKAVSEVYKTLNGKYTISYYADNIIKLTFTPNGYTKNENISDAVILKPKTIKPKLKVNVNGDLVAFNGKAILINVDTANGGYCFNFALETGEKIFGGGERALPLNRRGYRFNLFNNPWYGYGEGANDLNYSVPFFTSSKGYGLFFDNPSTGFVDIGKEEENVFKAGFSSGEINVYIILDNDYQNYHSVLQSYQKLTGTQPLPPRWAFGNLMSRFGYTSEAQAKDILGKMKKENVPVEAIIFDLFWFGDSIKGTLGNLDWLNRQKWPNPQKMISDFRKQGVNTILVTEPFFVETSKNYSASKPYLTVDSNGKPYYLTDFYFGKGGLIDIFRKDSKDWFWKFYKKQMDIGVEGWWGDLGEPEKHPANLYHNLKDLGQKRLFSANEVHNIYGHNWTKMLYEKYAQFYPNKRLFSLNRSGFAGSQRYSIFPWTGDVNRSWSGLRAQLPILLGMSMSGVPYVHSDAGGFAGGQGDNELYVRWLQFAAFTPIFRPHGTALYDVDPKAFSFPSEVALIDTPWREYAKEAIKMRYDFLPYNYSLAYQQAKNGKPLMAPFYYYFPYDTTAVNIQDQYMWGENLMVVPVLEKGAITRKYYLPEGNWLKMDSVPSIKTGGSWFKDTVSIKRIPVFVKEGGILIADAKNLKTTTSINRFDTLAIFYNADTKASLFQLFDDDGTSKNSLTTKKYELIDIWSSGIHDNGIEVRIKGSATGLKKNRFFIMVAYLSKKPKKVLVNNKPATDFSVMDDSPFAIFNFKYTGNPVTIKITF